MPAPSNTTAPALSGIHQIGYTLTCSLGVWSHGVDYYAYQWQSQQAGEHPYEDVAGATGNSYTIISGDNGRNLRCKVTATNASGSTIAYSNATDPIPNDSLIVETGAALTNANTYVDIDYANDYFAVRNISSWFDYSVGERKAFLIRAAVYIDGFDFIGIRRTETQSMQWPRYDVTVDRYAVRSDVVPKNIKDAQCEAALRFGFNTIQSDIDSGFVTSETVDVISISYSDNSNNGTKKFPVIESLLRKYAFSAGSRHRVVRS